MKGLFKFPINKSNVLKPNLLLQKFAPCDINVLTQCFVHIRTSLEMQLDQGRGACPR